MPSDNDLAEASNLRRAIHDWIRDDVPLAGKMNLMPKHVDALMDRIAALRARPEARAGDGTGWQDISTAPKDGTWILGAWRGRTWRMQWRQSQFERFRNGWHFCENGLINPTHWMPEPIANWVPVPTAQPNTEGRDA